MKYALFHGDPLRTLLTMPILQINCSPQRLRSSPSMALPGGLGEGGPRAHGAAPLTSLSLHVHHCHGDR